MLRLAETQLTRDQFGDRPDDRERVDRALEARHDALLRVRLVLAEQHLREARDDLVAAAHRGRAGADDLDEQRLRLGRVLVDHDEELAHPLAHAGDGILARLGDGTEDAGQQQLVRRVEQREDALLLVGEVLVEGRLRHAGGAADRFGARIGVAGRREDGCGRLEQSLALLREAYLERRSVTAARHRGTDGSAILASHYAINPECNPVTVKPPSGAARSCSVRAGRCSR